MKKYFNKRYTRAGFSTLLQAGACVSLILLSTTILVLHCNNASAYEISMTSSGAQNMDILPSKDGIGTSIGKDDISVTTTCPSGYNLSMSTSGNDNKLYKDGSNSSSSYFSPADGTTTLGSSTNTWGYYFNNSSSTDPTASSIFSAVPTLSSPATIKTSATSTTSDSFSLYYGVSVNSGLTPGSYKMTSDGTVVYYLTMDEACNYAGYMQDVTEEDLATLMPSEGNTVNLADKRDNNTYSIARINGKYWMTKNLDLAGGTTLTSELSNVNSSYTLPASSTTGFSDNSTAYVYNSNSTTCGDNSPCYSYYSYVAATAGTNPISGDARSDVCPKGWKMPSKSDFESLTNTYNTGAKLTASPFLAVYGGFFNDSAYYSRLGNDLLGAYWTSTAESSSNGHYIYYTDSIAASIADGKHYGGSVRCVYQGSKTYMQDVTDAQLAEAAPNEGDSITLYDKRDNNSYQITKINGNYWMTQNLRFTGATLTVVDSNVTRTRNITWEDMTTNSNCTSTSSSGPSMTHTCMYLHPSNVDYGAYYNYAGATAGTITGSSNSNEATESVCPAGWKLPSASIVNAITNSATYLNEFNPVLSGYIDYLWSNGLTTGGEGYWLTSTANYSDSRRTLRWQGGSTLTTNGNYRHSAYAIRCIHSS